MSCKVKYVVKVEGVFTVEGFGGAIAAKKVCSDVVCGAIKQMESIGEISSVECERTQARSFFEDENK